MLATRDVTAEPGTGGPVNWDEVPAIDTGGLVAQRIEQGGMVVARYELPTGFESGPLYRGLPNRRRPHRHRLIEITRIEDDRRKQHHLRNRG